MIKRSSHIYIEKCNFVFRSRQTQSDKQLGNSSQRVGSDLLIISLSIVYIRWERQAYEVQEAEAQNYHNAAPVSDFA